MYVPVGWLAVNVSLPPTNIFNVPEASVVLLAGVVLYTKVLKEMGLDPPPFVIVVPLNDMVNGVSGNAVTVNSPGCVVEPVLYEEVITPDASISTVPALTST